MGVARNIPSRYPRLQLFSPKDLSGLCFLNQKPQILDTFWAPGSVRELLKDVKRIQSSDLAFAAILGDGSAVTWGHPDRRCGQNAPPWSMPGDAYVVPFWF